MNRRDALKALAAVAGATGLTVTPVTTQDVQGVELVLLKSSRILSDDEIIWIRQAWSNCCKGTALERVQMIYLAPDLSIEVVRTKAS